MWVRAPLARAREVATVSQWPPPRRHEHERVVAARPEVAREKVALNHSWFRPTRRLIVWGCVPRASHRVCAVSIGGFVPLYEAGEPPRLRLLALVDAGVAEADAVVVHRLGVDQHEPVEAAPDPHGLCSHRRSFSSARRPRGMPTYHSRGTRRATRRKRARHQSATCGAAVRVRADMARLRWGSRALRTAR